MSIVPALDRHMLSLFSSVEVSHDYAHLRKYVTCVYSEVSWALTRRDPHTDTVRSCELDIRPRENNMAASIQSGELVAALEEPEPPWHEAGGKWDFEGGVEERPFVISRKWVADFKTYHGQVCLSITRVMFIVVGSKTVR